MPPMAVVYLLILVALPLIEIALLIKVASLIGIWLTLSLIIGTAFLGFWVAQKQGLGVARRIFQTMATGEPPVEPLLEGMLLTFAGACLIAPGLITDTFGAILMIPPLRRLAAKAILGHHLIEQLSPRKPPGQGPWRSPRHHHDDSSTTIEGSFERLDETSVGRKPPARTE